MKNKILILGSRGIPAKHGGFETFAQGLALYLVNKSWDVTVYCQEDNKKPLYETNWQGIRLIHIGVPESMGAVGTMLFDFYSILHAIKQPGVALTLGYNTAILSILHRLKGQRNVTNMDGIEWKREKWSRPQRLWFYINEWLGARLSNHLISDNPGISLHLERHTKSKKISMIPYAAEPLKEVPAESKLGEFKLTSKAYAIVVARPEPENSILTIVKSFVAAAVDIPLVVLGKFDANNNEYHREIMAIANEKVIFLGTVFDQDKLIALRYHATYYIHGHTVGGTNPSLVEAMAAGNVVIAHNNPFNQWVLGGEGIYFTDEADLSIAIKNLQGIDTGSISEAISARYNALFQPEMIYSRYEKIIERMAIKTTTRSNNGDTNRFV